MQIDDIAKYPQWVETLVEWHHAEWLRNGDWQKLNSTALAKSYHDRKVLMREHLQKGLVPTTFIAHDNAAPWGSISLVKYTLEPTAEAGNWLTNMYVAPSYRRKGVGSALLKHLEQWADAQLLGVLRLYTFDAVDFYLARGWKYERSSQLRGSIIDILKRVPGK